MVLCTFEAQCISLTIQKINASSQIKLIGEGHLCTSLLFYTSQTMTVSLECLVMQLSIIFSTKDSVSEKQKVIVNTRSTVQQAKSARLF